MAMDFEDTEGSISTQFATKTWAKSTVCGRSSPPVWIGSRTPPPTMRVLALLMMLAPVVVAFVPSSTGSVRPATALFSSVQKAQLGTPEPPPFYSVPSYIGLCAGRTTVESAHGDGERTAKRRVLISALGGGVSVTDFGVREGARTFGGRLGGSVSARQMSALAD